MAPRALNYFAIFQEEIMTISNRITLEQALKMPIGELIKLPTQQLALLLEDVAALKAHVKTADAVIYSVMEKRFTDQARRARQTDGKDTGTVRLDDDDFVVVADLPKTVKWNQAGLRGVLKQIETWPGENPAEYISTELKVSETSFNAWPSSIKKMFEPHRTVSAGKQTFKIEPKKEAA